MSATERLESPLAVAILKTLAGFTLAAAAVTR